MKQLLGYQIVSRTDNSDLPGCFTSFEVLEYSAANQWLALEHFNPEHGTFRWVLLPVFEGDIENFTFIEYI